MSRNYKINKSEIPFQLNQTMDLNHSSDAIKKDNGWLQESARSNSVSHNTARTNNGSKY